MWKIGLTLLVVWTVIYTLSYAWYAFRQRQRFGAVLIAVMTLGLSVFFGCYLFS